MNKMTCLEKKFIIVLIWVSLSLVTQMSLFVFWQFASEFVVSLINTLPIYVLKNCCPSRKLFGIDTSYHTFKIFSCFIFPLFHPYNRQKFSYRSSPYVYLSNSPSHFDFRCLDPSLDRIYIWKHVEFQEKVYPFKSSSVVSSLTSTGATIDPSPWLIVGTHLGSSSMDNSNSLSLNSPTSPLSSPSSTLSSTIPYHPESTSISNSLDTSSSISLPTVPLTVDLTQFDIKTNQTSSLKT